MQNSVTQT